MTNYEIIRELLPTLSALIAVASSSLRTVRGKVYSVTSVRTAIPLLMTFPTHF